MEYLTTKDTWMTRCTLCTPKTPRTVFSWLAQPTPWSGAPGPWPEISPSTAILAKKQIVFSSQMNLATAKYPVHCQHYPSFLVLKTGAPPKKPSIQPPLQSTISSAKVGQCIKLYMRIQISEMVLLLPTICLLPILNLILFVSLFPNMLSFWKLQLTWNKSGSGSAKAYRTWYDLSCQKTREWPLWRSTRRWRWSRQWHGWQVSQWESGLPILFLIIITSSVTCRIDVFLVLYR